MSDDFSPPPLSDAAKSALVGFARAAIPFLAARAPGGRIPVVTAMETRFSDSETRSWDEAIRAEDVRAIPIDARAYHEMLAIPEARDGVRVLWEEGQLPRPRRTDREGRSLVDEPFEQLISTLGQLPFDAVRLYLNERGRLDGELDPQQLELAFTASQREVMNVPVDVRASAPLKYFMTTPPRIDFPDGVAIARMSAADKANLWRDDYLDSTFTKMEFAGTWFRLVWQYQAPRRQASDTRDARERFDRVLSALRLAQPGHVEAPTLLAEVVPRKPPGGMSSHTKFRDTTSLAFFQGKQYRLDQRNIPGLLEIYTHLSALKSGGTARAFDLALRRYNQSFLRGEAEDSIIDLAIALESTLLAGTKDELKYRLALRGAALLRQHIAPREVYAFLSAFYNARSLIVHNGLLLQDIKASQLTGIAPHAFASKGQAIVRLVLLNVLQHLRSGGTLEELAKSLDEDVVSSLVPVGIPPEG